MLLEPFKKATTKSQYPAHKWGSHLYGHAHPRRPISQIDTYTSTYVDREWVRCTSSCQNLIGICCVKYDYIHGSISLWFTPLFQWLLLCLIMWIILRMFFTPPWFSLLCRKWHLFCLLFHLILALFHIHYFNCMTNFFLRHQMPESNYTPYNRKSKVAILKYIVIDVLPNLFQYFFVKNPRLRVEKMAI